MVKDHKDCRYCVVSKIVAIAFHGTAAVGEGIKKDVTETVKKLDLCRENIERVRIKIAHKSGDPPLL